MRDKRQKQIFSCCKKRKRPLFLMMMMMIFICALCNKGTAQNENLYVTQYTIEDGLRQSMVKNMVQDKNGILWMTTGDGLQCFDGSQFFLWRVPTKEPFMASDNMFRYMTQSDSNHLLLASPTSVTLFNKNKANYTLMHRGEGMFPVILKTKIYGFPLVWMANGNFYVVRKGQMEKIEVEYQDTNHQGYIYQGLKSVYLNDSVILIQTQKALLEFYFRKSERETITAKLSTFLMSGMVQAIERTKTGEIYLVVDDKLVKYMGNGNLKEVKQVPFKTCMAIFSVDNEKMLIADNDNKTLYQLNGDDLQKIAIFKIDSKTGISEEINPYIVSFFVDRDGILWICTDGHGIFSHNPNTILCKKNNVGFTRCIEEHNGKIIIGTFKNGLWETNPDLTNKRLINQNAIPASSDIFSIYSQNNQRLWVLTDTELVVLDNDYNLVFCERNKHQSGILHGCDDGKILVSQSGIARFYETSDFTYKRTFTPFKPITSIIRIKGEMIYGTSSELLTFNPKLFNRDTIYTHDLQILEKYPVKSMFLKDTALWTATNDGIWIWTFNVDKSTLEKKEHFLDNESIYSLLEDNYNRIWFSSNTGIGFLNTAEGTSHFLGPQHNLQSLEFNSYAALKSSRGWHYYGGINGVNAINPDAVKSEFTESAPVLSFLKVADTVYTNGIPDVHHLELSYSRANFSGLFGTINYRAGKSQLYSTKLVGNDSDWSPPSRTPDFGYQNLRRGKYEFWVKYANDIQQWSAPFLLLTVTVLPPLWLRWWFITLVATGLFLATYFVMRKLQERKYKRIIEDLEREAALERERLRISRDLHDELGAGLSLILLNVSQSKQNLNDTSKTERCFENIAKNTKSLYDSMSNLVWLLKPENQTFESLKTRIREMAGGLFEDAGMEYTISMPENGSTQKVKREAGQHLLLIVRETINNALRHAESTNMKLSINGAETTLQITIIDNGKGFVRGNVKAGGNGLKNLEQRTKILSGNMSIYSALGEGTTVIYKFPFHAIFEN